MSILVEFTYDGRHRVERLTEVEFVPRVGEVIALVKLAGGSLVVEQVIHAFGPDNGDQLIRLVSKFIPDKK